MSTEPRVNAYEVELDDHVTSVLDQTGSGVPLILIHAATMDKTFWHHGVIAEIDKVSETPRRIIAYDLRGHGRADDAPITTSVSQLAQDLLGLCNKLDLSKVDVGGISYGGAVAQQFALDYPQLVRSALLIGTLSRGVPAVFEERASLAEKHGMEALYEPTLTRWLFPDKLASNDASVQYVRQQLAKTKVANWAAIWRALGKLDLTERLHELKMPVLCLACKEDTSTPPAFLKRICELVQDGTYVEVEGGMHLFPLEISERTAGSIAKFLENVDETVGRTSEF